MTGAKTAYDPDAAALGDYTQQIQDMQLSSFDPGAPEGLDGVGESLKSLMAPSASLGRTIMMAGAPAAGAQDSYMSSFATPETVAFLKQQGIEQDKKFNPTATQDAYFRDVVDDIGTNAVESWRPNVDAMGASAKALSTVNSVVGYIPSMVGTPALFLANAGIDPAIELTRQGVDSKTAMGVGAVNLAVNALGMRLPAAFGTNLATRVATGAGSNLVLGVGADAASSAALDVGGYEQASEGYDPTDPCARGLDVLMGLAFGAKAHIDAPRLLPSQKDAVLVAMNADHFQRSTLPGEPIAKGADVRHQDGLDLAIKQILNGEPVDVATAVRAEDFALRPELRARLAAPPSVTPELGAPSGASYAAYRHALESGGKADARPIDPKSGRRLSEAYGTDQFIPTTWRTVVAKAKPSWAEGMTDSQLLEARSDPVKSAEMVAVLDAGHAASLEAASLPVNRHTLYASHHFGINKGKAFARAGDSTRMELILTEGQLKANPYLKGMTKAEAIASWDERASKAGVDVAQVDGSTAPRADGDLPPDSMTARRVEMPSTPTATRPTVDLLRSGESLFPEPPPRASLDEYAAWMEGRQRGYVAAERQAMQTIVQGDPVEAQAKLPVAQRMTPDEAQTRLVELDRMEAETASRFAATDPVVREAFDAYAAQQGARTELPIVEFRREAARVEGALPPVMEGNTRVWRGNRPGEVGKATTYTNDLPGIALPFRKAYGGDLSYVDVPTSRLAEYENKAGAAPGAEFNLPNDLAARAAAVQPDGQGKPAATRPAQQPLLTAEAVARLDPALRIPTGELDADGNPVTTSASDYLAAAKAEAAQADVDALAIHAAADCFLRSAA